MRHSTSLLALVLAAASFSASAAIGTQVSGGPLSPVGGTTLVDFDSPIPLGISYSAGYVTMNTSISTSAAPPGDSSYYLTVGPTTPVTATFGGTGATYFGFMLGSPDNYNAITFTSSDNSTKTFSGADFVTGTLPPINADGNQGNMLYFGAYASAGTTFKSVTFTSTSYAMETDNHSFILAAVPEPESYAMMAAGLGLLGWVARRRAKTPA